MRNISFYSGSYYLQDLFIEIFTKFKNLDHKSVVPVKMLDSDKTDD